MPDNCSECTEDFLELFLKASELSLIYENSALLERVDDEEKWNMDFHTDLRLEDIIEKIGVLIEDGCVISPDIKFNNMKWIFERFNEKFKELPVKDYEDLLPNERNQISLYNYGLKKELREFLHLLSRMSRNNEVNLCTFE